MSESAYAGRLVGAFMREHPAADGWSVFRLGDISDSYGIEMLPAFLRDRAAGAVQAERIWTGISWTAPRTRSKRRLRGAERTLPGQGFEEKAWNGTISFIWAGEPVHVCRMPFVERYSNENLNLVATKELSVWESLWKELRVYARRAARPQSMIQMVAGYDIPKPKDRWEDLILPGTLCRDIRRDTEGFMKARKQYAALRLPYRRGFLFAGPPGCGKTKTVRVIAAQSRATVLGVTLKADINDDVLRDAFGRAERLAPSILILEDLDRITEAKNVSMSYVLNLLDGLDVSRGILLLATTNHPEKLDAALLHRPSRFDKVWHFPLPGFSERLELLHRKSLGKFSEQAIDAAARQSQGFTMAYVQETAVNAFLAALYADRPPQDKDLTDSVRALKDQMASSFKADGAMATPKSVGFASEP